MTTQLEAIIRALEISKRPMTASELADVLVKNGSGGGILGDIMRNGTRVK